MAKFYGSVIGNRGEATRLGHTRIKTAARSWDGSIVTELTYNDKNELMVCVSTSNESSALGQQIFYGTFDEFVNKLKA